MKEITCNWLEQKKVAKVYDTFEEMIQKERFIGFIPEDDYYRYMIMKAGNARGIAHNITGYWAINQAVEKGKYYCFESAKELYLWMAEGEEE